MSKERKQVGPVQGSQEWRDERLGFFTASKIAVLCKSKGIGDGGITYIRKKAYEAISGVPTDQVPDTDAIRWGREFQWDAIEHVEKTLKCNIEGSPFYRLPGLNVGASPDGIIRDSSVIMKSKGKQKPVWGVEIKCPFNGENHIEFLECKNVTDLKVANDEYYWQCIAGLFVLQNHPNFKKVGGWLFVSYHPLFPQKSRAVALKFDVTDPIVVAELAILEKRVTEARQMYERLVTAYGKDTKK